MITDSLCRSLVLVCRSTIIAACAVAFAACSGGSSNLPPQQSEAAAKTLGIPTNGQVAVYAPGSSSPKYAIKEGIYQPSVLAFDATKTHLYVGNSTASFTVYKAGKKSLLLNVLEWNPTAIAFDASGNVYVANSSGSTCGTTDGEPTCNVVLVYPPLSKSPSGGITTGIDNPDALAFDKSGNLYVANLGGGNVTVYASGKSSVKYTIEDVYEPTLLTFDAKRTYLYVGSLDSSVAIYKAGKKSPLLSVPEWNPTAIAFDASGNVYVANSSGSSCGTTEGYPGCNVVLVYPPLSKSPSGGISTGIDNPDALAFDSSGNLYVANEGGNTVTVYAAGSGTPSRTISIGIHHPDALAIDADGNLYVADACGSC